MTREELLERAYKAFSSFEKPEQCTRYPDFEDTEFNAMLLSATRRSLTIEQVGIVTWGPIPCMNPEALAYFMPRLIELAVSKAIDRDGDPFFCHFTNVFHDPADDPRFGPFGSDQRSVMADAFQFLCENYYEQLKSEEWLDLAQRAINHWRTATSATK